MYLCYMKNKTKFIPIVGDTYGTWTVISDELKIEKQKLSRSSGYAMRPYWWVRCRCGIEKWYSAAALCNRLLSSKGCKSCAKARANYSYYIKRIERRARVSGFEFTITKEIIEDLYKQQNGKCKLSGVDIVLYNNQIHTKRMQSASLDRINSNKGYTIDNVQWLHKDVNKMKYTFTQERFIEICRMVAKNTEDHNGICAEEDYIKWKNEENGDNI